VRDHDNRRARLHQFRQEFVVEFVPKFGILIGRPFVQQQNGAFLKQTYDECETFALTARQVFARPIFSIARSSERLI
jgi:hypothetical protein